MREFKSTLEENIAKGNYVAIPVTLLHTHVTVEIKKRGHPVSISGELNEITAESIFIDGVEHEKRHVYGIKPYKEA
jgi:hypothetical protein